MTWHAVGRRLFTDGIVRVVFEDAEGQYVLGPDGERVRGTWLPPERPEKTRRPRPRPDWPEGGRLNRGLVWLFVGLPLAPLAWLADRLAERVARRRSGPPPGPAAPEEHR